MTRSRVSAPGALLATPTSARGHPVALYLTRNLATGGAERVFIDYVNNAQSLSPVVALLERRGGLLPELSTGVPFEARVDRTAVPRQLEAIASEIPGESFARLALECLWLKDVAKQTGADVVSSFLMRAHVVALVTKIALLPDVPVVLNIHEHMSDSAPFLYPLKRDRALMRWVTRCLFPRADRIIVVAEELKRDLVASHGVPADLIEVVHNPLHIERIRAAGAESVAPRWMSPAGTRTIVAVGRLVYLKGYDLLLHALAKLRATRDVRLMLVGKGVERGELEKLAAQLGVQAAVTFAGEHINPWKLIARADVLALTSRTEAFPSVLGEAMALGVPVLATDCSGGVRECLRDGAAGLIVATEDVSAIARGLERILEDAELRATLVAAGHARAASFDLPERLRHYESVLSRVMLSRTT
ncbi:MAG: glycosyltransferase [Gemmatimonadaceae bacterium]|nr:glycosyltransferase [Gemmatimonadaceae bacterium]MDQ3520648.1 glycosyltransferase [Gemmatimonadota bacterium]